LKFKFTWKRLAAHLLDSNEVKEDGAEGQTLWWGWNEKSLWSTVFVRCL